MQWLSYVSRMYRVSIVSYDFLLYSPRWRNDKLLDECLGGWLGRWVGKVGR